MKMERPMDTEYISGEVMGVPQKELKELLQKPLFNGDTWYLVCKHWYNKFEAYNGVDKTYPGPIDNSLILDSALDDIRPNLVEDTDYVICPEEMWNLLMSWYGLTVEQKPIPKKVVQFGVFNSYFKVEIYLITITLRKDFKTETDVVAKFSHGDTIDDLHSRARDILKIPENTVSRLWGNFSPSMFDVLDCTSSTIVTAGLYHQQVVVVETRTLAGQWAFEYRNMCLKWEDDVPCAEYVSREKDVAVTTKPAAVVSAEPASDETSAQTTRANNKRSATVSTPVTTAGPSNMITRYSTREPQNDGRPQASAPGVCGLANLGNTCFMNAILQCMSNSPPITDFFFYGHYVKQLNVDNPLGMNGQIASSYAELIRMMWSGQYVYAVPHSFKLKVGSFAPSFSGYQQQDAQELLTFLLDGLHEDLNRIKDKPYIESRDADGRPDLEVAKEAWENYLKRNDSIIVDFFHGLLKSTVVCPDCQKVSVTFDPFCYLSLPLPAKKERFLEVLLFPYDALTRPTRYKFSVPQKGSIQDLINILSGFCKIPADQLMVVQVVKNHFHKIYEPNQALCLIDDKDTIHVYELPKNAVDLNTNIVLPVYILESGVPSMGGPTSQMFGHPLVIVLARNEMTYQTLFELIMKKLTLYMNEPNDNSAWWIDQQALTNGVLGLINEEDDNRLIGDRNNHANHVRKLPFLTLSFSNDPDLTDLEVLPCDGNIIQMPAVMGRRVLIVEWSSDEKTQYFNDQAMKEIPFLDKTRNRRFDTLELSECFQHYLIEEKLGVNDAWYCPNCAKHQCASKKFDLWHLPRILVIHLKRFSYNRLRREKLETMIHCPLENMDLSRYVIGPDKENSKYNLIGVCNHSGGLGGGHYTATALNKDTKLWYTFDDATVSEVSKSSVVSTGAYVLFYMRNDLYTEQMETD